MRKHADARSSRWDLIGCALRGHETYEPIGSKQATRLSSQLSMETPHGSAWRCLRCGTYVVSKPRYRAPLERAPLVVRGKVLRQTLILRFLAAERGIRAILLVTFGFVILHFKSTKGSLQQLLQSDLPSLKAIAHSFGYNLDTSHTLHTIQQTLNLTNHALDITAVLIFLYAAVLGAETVGLWLAKRWGEYFSAVATSVFIPLEIYELIQTVTVLKIGAITINVAAVLYLVITKRLFGIRGGGKAYEKALESDNLLELTKAAA